MKIKSLILASTLAFTMPAVSFASQPENLAVAKAAVVQYYNSGQYNKDLTSVANHAIYYLNKRVAENNKLAKPKKLAIVFDIDETTLSNYKYMKQVGFAGVSKKFMQDQLEGNDPAIKPVQKLYRAALKDNVAVFFITGRPDSMRAATLKNLESAGYIKYAELFTKPDNYNQKSAIPYKSSARKQIENKGFDIIITIGDQYSDLKGGYADKAFKLPNPFYYVP